AVGGETEAHEEEEREQPGGEHRWVRQMNLVRAARGHEIVDGGDAHHVEEAAAEGIAVGRFGRVMEAALGQSFVAERAVAPAILRDFLAAKRTLSNAHAPLGALRGETCTQDTTCVASG